jgi:acyl-CoA synthetase (AMP-forming)/AMP-acid ligase II
MRPGETVAMDMYNCSEYLEVFFAALKLRAVPANVNYRYLDDELRRLLQQSDAGHDPPPPVGVLPAPYDHPGARRELSFALVDAAAQEQFGTTAGAAGGDLF